MANPWFRLYSEFASDPKTQSMNEQMQRRLVMLFCLRCGNVLETLQEPEIVYALGITQEEWEETKELFVTKCFIRFIKGKCNIVNWNKRQFISDSSTERVRKYRAKNETLQKRNDIVTVTPPDTDTDTDTDTEQNHIEENNKPERHEYGSEKNVLLTDAQYHKFLSEMPQAALDACIDELSTYKAMKGYKYKRDDLAMRKWVIDKVKAEKPELFKPQKPAEKSQMDLAVEAMIKREYAERGQNART